MPEARTHATSPPAAAQAAPADPASRQQGALRGRMRHRLQTAAWAYAGIFAVVVIVGHLPGVNDEQGMLFGLFHITPYQDVLHGLSGVWAAVAAWRSPRQARIFLQWFGTIYFLDGVLGAVTGVTFLDFGIFTGKEAVPGPTLRILVNIPHILIGGIAMVMGWRAARRGEGDEGRARTV